MLVLRLAASAVIEPRRCGEAASELEVNEAARNYRWLPLLLSNSAEVRSGSGLERWESDSVCGRLE